MTRRYTLVMEFERAEDADALEDALHYLLIEHGGGLISLNNGDRYLLVTDEIAVSFRSEADLQSALGAEGLGLHD